MALTYKPKLSELTLREKIGQTCQMQTAYLMNMENLEEYLAENPIGQVWHTCNTAMTTVNLADIEIDEPMDSTFYRKWTQRMDAALRIPALFGLDGPGRPHATDMVDLVSVPVLGANDSEEVVEQYGKYLAMNARALGGNWVWSPNVDLPQRFSGISIMRQLSSDPDRLVKLSLAMIRGAQANGLAMGAKHFPGKDKIEYRDGHFADELIRTSKEDWLKGQGKVFQDMIDGGVWSIMPGHQAFPAVDNSRINGGAYIPTTLSYKILTKLLKEEMGFKGVVVTDAIEMAALKTAYPNKEDLFVALLNAGNDVLLNVKRLDYVDIIERAVKDGRVSEARIDDACQRILDMKEKMGMFTEKREEIVMTEDLRQEILAFNTKAAENALVLQCDKINQIPLDPAKIKNVAIICSSHSDTFHKSMHFMKEEFERRGIKVHLQRRLTSYPEIEKIAAENDLILYLHFVMPHIPMGGSGLFCEECAHFFFALHEGKEKSIGVSMGSPYVYYDYCSNMDTYIHAFSTTPATQVAVVKALFGEIGFNGHYPYEEPWKEDEEILRRYD